MQLLPDYVTQGEARAAESLVRALIATGYAISVYDGMEMTVQHSLDVETVCRALATTDADRLYIAMRDSLSATHVATIGSILLVWGNASDGSELASDWSWDDRTQAGRDFNAFMDSRI